MTTKHATTIDEYIAAFPPDVRTKLEKVRQAIRRAVPKAEEAISYRIPTFRLNGRYLIYFAGFRQHIGVYPVHADDPALGAALAPYSSGKATLKFPLDQPIPLGLIARLVKAKAQALQ
jgi:uncharacterized protein YdhG (YjbR/CyaY superfamily)